MPISSDTQLNGADVGFVPLFKKNPWPARKIGRQPLYFLQILLHFLYQDAAQCKLTNHRRQLEQHVQDTGHTALVEDGDLHPGAHQTAGNVGLHVGKTQHTVGL
jgi:hypothetical protein